RSRQMVRARRAAATRTGFAWRRKRAFRHPCVRNGPVRSGALGGIRTPDPQIRSLVLYPAELRALEAWPQSMAPIARVGSGAAAYKSPPNLEETPPRTQ